MVRYLMKGEEILRTECYDKNWSCEDFDCYYYNVCEKEAGDD